MNNESKELVRLAKELVSADRLSLSYQRLGNEEGVIVGKIFIQTPFNIRDFEEKVKKVRGMILKRYGMLESYNDGNSLTWDDMGSAFYDGTWIMDRIKVRGRRGMFINQGPKIQPIGAV